MICRSLLKEDINYWENREETSMDESINEFLEELEAHETEILEISLCEDSEEVAYHVAGYVAKKVLKKTSCTECRPCLVDSENDRSPAKYLNTLSRGGLIHPSRNLAFTVSSSFAQVEYIHPHIKCDSVRRFSEKALQKYVPRVEVSCLLHEEVNRASIIKIVINCFYNNMQKHAADSIRKEAIVDFKKRQRIKKD